MIYELRIYTVKQGTLAEVAKNSGTVARNIRGDDYGKLEGYWMTEVGPLNQVMHLWSYKDLNERERLRAELSKNKRWADEYIPLARANIVRQDIRLLNEVIAPRAPAKAGNLYEFRNYRLKPGCVGPWLKAFQESLPIREKYSKIVGLWSTEAGQPNEVCHIWAYPDFAARMAARSGSAKDPQWQEFVKKVVSYYDEMHSTLMIPSEHSPLK